MFGQFLVAWVATMLDLTDLIGDRVQAFEAGQDMPRPYVTYQRISSLPKADLGGPTGITDEAYQLSIVADTRAEAIEIASLLAGTAGDERLDGYSGTLGGVVVRRCLLQDERDNPIEPVTGTGRRLTEIQQDYAVAIDRSI